jgi:hypothetical protein
MQRSGRKRGRALLVVMAIGLAPLAMYTAAARTASLSVRTERADDVARVVREARGTTIEVTSPFGIGRMIVSPPAHGAWPSPLRLRLRYAAGRPLRSLEGLDMSVDGTVVATREAMRVEAGRGWLEVVLPADVAQAGKPIRVQWVDAYR